MARAIDVASQADWDSAALAVAAAGAGSTVTINITGSFTLTSSLTTLQASNSGVTVNITGNSQAINGASTYQGIQISGANAPTVNISNLSVVDTAAQGGAGAAGQAGYASSSLSYGSGGGGGGGLGAGGGLFVGSGANVTLASVTFTGNSAAGGAGGAGGSVQTASSSPTGGDGGAGGTLNGGATAGGGGAGGSGGNTGTQGTAGTAGTAGNGGGGGGGSGTTSRTTYTQNNGGGAGGSGAGAGGEGGDGTTNYAGSQGPGADGGRGGVGGGAQGGAIYVQSGATLTILDSGISGATVTGGSGGSSGTGFGPSSVAGGAGAAGAAAGAGIYLSGVTANIGVTTGTLTYANTIGGAGLTSGGVTTAINKTGAGMLVLSGANTFTGNVDISEGTLSVAAQNNLGRSSKMLVMSSGTTFAMSTSATFSNALAYMISGASTFDVASGATSTLAGVIADGTAPGQLVKTNAGTLILSGTNSYSGGTTVTGGTLQLNAAAALPAGPVQVNSGATLNLNGFDQTFSSLAGAGAVTGANPTIGTGGTFAPGDGTPNSAMAITGNLAFQSGAAYVVQVNPAIASTTNVTGTATLGNATVNATFANGSYISKIYTILTASGGVSGTFGTLVNNNLPANFTASLSYDATTAYLNLQLNFTPSSSPNFGSGLSTNQQNVANTLVNYFNSNGSIPLAFGALSPGGLTQVSGETATGAQQATIDAMTQFLGLITDPFSPGRNAAPPGATGFAAEQDAQAYAADGRKRTAAERQAYAMVVKAPPREVLDPRWNVWSAGFGGARTTDGNTALGSNRTTASIAGGAVGADHWFSPFTVAGFAMAGGGTSFSVANGGSGNSDLFQAGAFVRHNAGSAYITAAAAYGWQAIRTDRLVTAAGFDRLRASFNANAYSGRIEGGNRWAVPALGGLGITPYAAVQVTAFDLPAYAETAAAGVTTFALAYAARTVTDTRSELGLRTDKSYAIDQSLLTLRGRVAWAHDFNIDRNVQASFQTLPGTGFVVNGAVGSRDAALTSASAEMNFRNGWSLTAAFDGEFSDATRSYAGKGVARYQW